MGAAMRLGWVVLLGLGVLLAAGCSPVRRPRVAAPAPVHPRNVREGVAARSAPAFHGTRTCSGERFDQYDFTAAHRTLPLGSWVVVTNKANGRSIQVYVNDRGRYIQGRVIDLSYAAARAIGMLGPGTVPVRIVVLGTEPPEPRSVLVGER